MKIYLAGPITGCTFGECTDWRNQFEDLVNTRTVQNGPGRGGKAHAFKNDANFIQCLSPMRGKDYLKDAGVIDQDYPEHVMSCSRGIMTRDYYDCTRVDLVVANLLLTDEQIYGGQTLKVSIGTAMEIAWAYHARIPVIAVMEPSGNPHDHPMIREAIGFRVTSLEQAAHTVRMILWP